jgi:hypothetical protein
VSQEKTDRVAIVRLLNAAARCRRLQSMALAWEYAEQARFIRRHYLPAAY